MRKLFTFLVLGLLFSGNANASSIWDYLEIGMTKKQLHKQTYVGGKIWRRYYKTEELKKLWGVELSHGAFCSREDEYGKKAYNQAEYYSEYKTEIFTHRPQLYIPRWIPLGSGNPKRGYPKRGPEKLYNWPWYVFENVTISTSSKCEKDGTYKKGSDGILKAVVWSKEEAILLANPAYAKKLKEKKKLAAEEKRAAEEKLLAAHRAGIKKAKEKRVAEEKRIAEEKKKAEENKKEKEKKIAEKPKEKKTITKAPEIDESLLTIGSGSGFYINNKGYALTNNHVVDICKQMVAVVDGREILFRVLNTDKTNDVAIIKTDQRSPNFIKINEDGAKLGEDIIAVGYPLSGRLSDSVKITRGIVSALSGMNNNSGQIQIDAALQPGNSGGPVINESGELIGIASAGLNKLLMAKEAKYIPENVNFAVSSSIVTNILKNKKVSYSTPSFFSGSYSNTELATLGDKVTLQLFCRNTRTAYNKLKQSKNYTHILIDLD
jgi:S1-C subfamily serine protease